MANDKACICIINPPSLTGEPFVREGRCEQRTASFQYNMMPVSLFTIASNLRDHKFPVTVIDAIANQTTLSALLEALTTQQPLLIVVNVSSGTYNNDTLIIKSIKEHLPYSHITAIGNHVSALSKEALAETLLDSVIIGEPELAILELAKALQNKTPFNNIQSIAYKVGEHINVNPRRNYIKDLNSLPFPARDIAPNEKYFMPIIEEPYTLIITSRGCPYNCIFCTANQYYGKKVRERSVENIIAEIKEIKEKHKINNVTMWSDTFTFRKEFVMGVCQGLIDQNIDINWWCNSRVDKVTSEILALMKKSGCKGISFGVESGVQEILDNIKKNINTEDIQKAFKWTNEAGIECLAHVIFGLPGETKETAEQTIKFVIGLKPTYAQFYCAIPFPGTEFHKLAKENNWLTTTNWDQFEINQAIVSTDKLTSEELQKIKQRAFRKFYLRPSYIFKQLFNIKSIKDFTTKFRQAISFIKSWVVSK